MFNIFESHFKLKKKLDNYEYRVSSRADIMLLTESPVLQYVTFDRRENIRLICLEEHELAEVTTEVPVSVALEGECTNRTWSEGAGA